MLIPNRNEFCFYQSTAKQSIVNRAGMRDLYSLLAADC